MAKKNNKNFKIEAGELEPVSLGVFENKRKNSIGMILILVILVLFVIFLPQISSFVNKYLNPEEETYSDGGSNNNTIDVDEIDTNPTEENSLYLFSSTLSIEKEDITLDNFSLDVDNLTLTYSITNINATPKIEDLNYYIEIYDSTQTLLERIKLVTTLTLVQGNTKSVTRTISENSANNIGYIDLVKKTDAEYPEVTLSTVEDGNGVLTCTNSHETVTYTFNDDGLTTMSSEVEYNTEDENYISIYTDYSSKVTEYNNKSGITSLFISEDTGFRITTSVDLLAASETYIFNADTFSEGTEPKVVSFEMEAQGFTCK